MNYAKQGAALGQAAYNAGVRAVLRCVYRNLPLREADLGGGDMTEDERHAIRYLRQKMWGVKSAHYDKDMEKPAMLKPKKRAEAKR